MGKVVKLQTKRAPAQLLCSGCGVSAEAQCDCGVAYVPAAKAAAKAIARNPNKSDRAIAEELGVSKTTVVRAREEVVQKGPPEDRVGRDGKTYPATKPTRQRVPVDAQGAKRAEVNKLLQELWGAGSKVERYFEEHPDLEEEGKQALLDMLMKSADRLMTLAQRLDGR